jgi:hypothetical protein
MTETAEREPEPEPKLRLGSEIAFSKRPLKLEPDVRRGALPDRVPMWKGIPLDMSRASRPFLYESKAVSPPREVFLEGEGLGQLYVCFGAPGTGKSYLLKQLLKQLAKPDWKPSWGGLLLDPKQTLIKEVLKEIPAGPFHLISNDKSSQRINILKSALGPRDLGVALALAAESGGISAKEPYWLNEMKRIFGAGLALLEMRKKPMTLLSLAELLLLESEAKPGEPREPRFAVELSRLRESLRENPDPKTDRNCARVTAEFAQYQSGRGNNADTVRSFISQVLSPFLDPELDHLSDSDQSASLADLIFAQGKWVLLDIPKKALSVSRMLSALAKVLFQRAALDREASYPEQSKRRVFLFVDEYAELASDLPGEGFGDSIFFSQARQFKVLSFIATQGVPMLENSGVREAWKTILSNSAGKIFFRVSDPDSAELASKLLGEGEQLVADHGVTQSPEGGNIQRSEKLERRTVLTSDLFATALGRGQFVFLGTTTGRGVVGFGDKNDCTQPPGKRSVAGLLYVQSASDQDNMPPQTTGGS